MNLTNTPLVAHVLVADSALARLLRVTGPRRHRVIRQVEPFERPSAHLPAHELTTDRTGRVFDSPSLGGTIATHTRYGAASHYDPHTAEIEHIAKHIVQHVQALHPAGELNAWALIAEPRLLGVLRAHLAANLHKLIVREISGDYVLADHERILELVDSPGG